MRLGEAHGAHEDPVAMQVVRHICTLIETGVLLRGERLAPEREFARELKISRASLRAGVGYLAAMGVLQVRHGVGTFVVGGPPALNPITMEVMSSLHGFTSRHMFEARFLIEGGIAALAAERGTDEQFKALADELSAMEGTLEDPLNYLIHDVSFHRILGQASGNPFLGALMETISTSVYGARRENIVVSRDIPKAARAHRLLYEAVRHRQVPEARHLMEQHLLEAEAGLLQDMVHREEEEAAGAHKGT